MKLEVLLVDDDPTVIFMHKRLLNNSIPAKTCVVANDGSQAIKYVLNHEDNQANFLILLDINMPVMDGWGFLDAIQGHEVANRCYVVMVTSSIDNHDKLKSANYPQVIGFFEKPMNLETCMEIKHLNRLSPFFQAN